MMANFSQNGIRVGLVIVLLLALAGVIIYAFVNNLIPSAEVQHTPVAIIANTPTPTAMPPTKTPTPVPTSTPQPSATATSAVPPGGIVYVLEPDINSVGLVQEGQDGNLFGESPLRAGVREGELNIGAMQFDLSFILDGSTIFMSELELVGLEDQGLTDSSDFEVSILPATVDTEWSRHNFETLRNIPADTVLKPRLEASELKTGNTNVITFNAAQRSIIEDRLADNAISFRIDSLFPEGWFAWDSGYGTETMGQRPRLRLGVLPPPATEAAAVEPPPNSTPTPTPTFIMITSTPEPENVLTAAAQAPTATYEAETTGTPTPVPENWVTPWIITATPTAENAATARYMVAEATAIVIAYGTPTPLPPNMVTSTPTATGTPTPVFIVMDGDLPPLTPTATASLTPAPTPTIPPALIGKIAFKSNRTGEEQIYVINADGTGLALLTNPWPYNVARFSDQFSADGRFRVFTKTAIRYSSVGGEGDNRAGMRTDAPAIFWYDSKYGEERQLTFFGQGLAYDGVWSPGADEIAFMSNDSGDDEIWVASWDASYMRQLTESNELYNAREIGKDTFVPELNGHPSWSPDGSQIVFWSNRNGSSQIWVMNADGSNPYTLSKPNYSDWAPVWIKYPGVPGNAQQIHIPYTGKFDPFGVDRDCAEFTSPAEVEAFFLAAGGPAVDPHELDPDQDGQPCK